MKTCALFSLIAVVLAVSGVNQASPKSIRPVPSPFGWCPSQPVGRSIQLRVSAEPSDFSRGNPSS